MTTHYLDLVNGNNANNGTSWALAKLTVAGITASAGDTIRVAKTADPVDTGLTATWTDDTTTIVTSSNVTKIIDDCETGWVAGLNVTVTNSTDTCRIGSKSTKIVTGATVTAAQLLAYKTISSTDYSAYQLINFWMMKTGATTKLEIRLCSDTLGVTAVNTFTVNHLGQSGVWESNVQDYGGALGAAIQSIAIYCTDTFANDTIYFDNFFVSKASGADSITLHTLLGTSSSAQGAEFYSILGANNTTIYLESYGSSTVQLMWSGTTASPSLYKISPVVNSTAANPNIPANSGSLGNLITWSGGWDTGSTTQNGETWQINKCSAFNIWTLSSRSYLKIERWGAARCYSGFPIVLNGQYISNCQASANTIPFGTSVTVTSGTINVINVLGCARVIEMNNTRDVTLTCSGRIVGAAVDGIKMVNNCSRINVSGTWTFRNCCYRTSFNEGVFNIQASSDIFLDTINIKQKSGLGNGLFIGYYSPNGRTKIKSLTIDRGSVGLYCASSILTMFNTTITNTTTYAFSINTASTIEVYGGSTTSNSTGSVFIADYSVAKFFNFTMNESSKVTFGGLLSNGTRGYVYCHNDGNVVDSHKTYTSNGNIVSDSTTRHTASGISWKISPTSTNATILSPITIPVAKAYVTASSVVTATLWMRRDNTGVSASFILDPYMIDGITSEVSSSITAAANTWEQVTITFTPSSAGIIEFRVAVYGGTTYNVWIDDFDITQ
mgnify:CR=1 FL=1